MGLSFEDLRGEYGLAGGHVWMQTAGGAPLPRRARDAVSRAAAAMHESMDWPQQYAADRQALREALGRLVGARPENVTLVRSTGHGLSLAARGLEWQPGDNVVGARWEYPTNVLPWLALRRHGVEVRLAEPRGGRVTPEALLALVDERTRVVAVSLVQFWNGYRVDVAALGAECRRRGVLLVVDGIQGVGAVRLDVTAAGVDVLACGAIKWLLGPVGIGFCALSPVAIEQLEPITVGAGSVTSVEDAFDPVLEYAPAARRFEESATSWLDVAGLLASVQLLEEFGFDAVEDRVLSMTSWLGEQLAGRGHEIVEPWPRSRAESSGILSFRTPGVAATEQLARLDDAGITARVHGDMLRLSPHVWISDTELERTVEVLAVP